MCLSLPFNSTPSVEAVGGGRGLTGVFVALGHVRLLWRGPLVSF